LLKKQKNVQITLLCEICTIRMSSTFICFRRLKWIKIIKQIKSMLICVSMWVLKFVFTRRQQNSATLCFFWYFIATHVANRINELAIQQNSKQRWTFIQVAAKKSSPLKFFAVFSATVWNFNMEFYSFIYRNVLHLTAKWNMILLKKRRNYRLLNMTAYRFFSIKKWLS